jgi:hypothetical protein
MNLMFLEDALTKGGNMLRVLSTLCASMVLLLAIGQAQTTTDEIVATIPNQFTVGTQTLPAGQYFFTANIGANSIQVRSADGKHAAIGMIYTRIAKPETISQSQNKVVFDVRDNQYSLSEVWVSGEDGFALPGHMQASHTHATVKASSRKAS